MASFDITGKLVQVFDTEEKGGNGFKIREFVIEEGNEQNPDWNNFHKFQLTKDRCDLIDKYNVGDTLQVFFNLGGRKWESPEKGTMYFPQLSCWRIHQEEGNVVPQYQVEDIPAESDPDDMPF